MRVAVSRALHTNYGADVPLWALDAPTRGGIGDLGYTQPSMWWRRVYSQGQNGSRVELARSRGRPPGSGWQHGLASPPGPTPAPRLEFYAPPQQQHYRVHGVAGLDGSAVTAGVAQGAMAGAVAGSVVPGIGTAVGAVVGAAAGYFSGKAKEGDAEDALKIAMAQQKATHNNKVAATRTAAAAATNQKTYIVVGSIVAGAAVIGLGIYLYSKRKRK